MTHVTLEFHRVRPKQLLRQWYVRHNPCTYLVSRLAITLNSLNWASTWTSSPRSTIGCVQNNFWACGTFGTNRAPIMRQDLQYLQTNWIKHPLEPRTQGVPSGVSKTFFEPMVRLAQTLHLSCVKISTIGCVQNDFWAYGMFSTNHAPILHRHQQYLQIEQKEIPHDPRHLGVPSGVSKMISEAVVRSWQTVHLSCVNISTIFEWS
jgi:hypothetical protein